MLTGQSQDMEFYTRGGKVMGAKCMVLDPSDVVKSCPHYLFIG